MKEKASCYFGTLEKSETLSPANVPGGEDTLVFESRSPFWGYYDDFPGKHNDNIYLYLTLAKPYTFVELHRILLKVEQELDFEANMDYATLYISHNQYTAIRVRYLKEMEQVPVLQKKLSQFGIDFLQGKGKNDAPSTTKITKYFSLKAIGEGIWLDCIADNHGYIQLEKRLELQAFKSLAKKVHNNWQGSSFDAGLVTLTSENRVIEAVRIYSTHVKDENYLSDLKRLFNY